MVLLLKYINIVHIVKCTNREVIHIKLNEPVMQQIKLNTNNLSSNIN